MALSQSSSTGADKVEPVPRRDWCEHWIRPDSARVWRGRPPLRNTQNPRDRCLLAVSADSIQARSDSQSITREERRQAPTWAPCDASTISALALVEEQNAVINRYTFDVRP